MRITIVDRSQRFWEAEGSGRLPIHPSFVPMSDLGQLPDGSLYLHTPVDLYRLQPATLTANAAAYLALTGIDALCAGMPPHTSISRTIESRLSETPKRRMTKRHARSERYEVLELDVAACWCDGLGRAHWMVNTVPLSRSVERPTTQRHTKTTPSMRKMLRGIEHLVRPDDRQKWRSVNEHLKREVPTAHSLEQLRASLEQIVLLEPLPVRDHRPKWALLIQRGIDNVRAWLGRGDVRLRRLAASVEQLAVDRNAQRLWLRRGYFAALVLTTTVLGLVLVS